MRYSDDYDVCPECGYPVHATACECGKCGEKLAPRFRDRLAQQAQDFLSSRSEDGRRDEA